MQVNGLRILVVDNEQAIRRYLRTVLRAEGHQVFEAIAGEESLQEVLLHRPDLMVLDLNLPDLSGVEVLTRLREWSQMPVIILSVSDREPDKIAAFDAGADDYITKPFSTGELLARIRVAMRHTVQPADEPVFELGALRVDLAHRYVTVNGEEVQLTPIEYDILKNMVIHAGKVMTHQQLLQKVWGVNHQNETHLLRVHVSNLRSKIESDPTQPNFIITEPGVGYRFLFPIEI